MTLKTRKSVFGAVIAVALIFWIAETGYFGWNMHPQTHAEVVCDQIVSIIFFSALLAFLLPPLAFFRAVNPFRRVTWFYFERAHDGREVVSAYRVTRMGNALLLAGTVRVLDKLIRSSGVPSRMSRLLIVTRVVEFDRPTPHV